VPYLQILSKGLSLPQSRSYLREKPKVKVFASAGLEEPKIETSVSEGNRASIFLLKVLRFFSKLHPGYFRKGMTCAIWI
jgi:hypothetical protein